MDARAGALGRAREVGEGVQRAWPVRIVLKFIADRGPNQAVLIAWNFLQTLIPIVLIFLAVGGFLLHLVGMNEDSIRNFIFNSGAFPAGHGTRDALVGAISGAQQHSGIFAILALVSFLWSASTLFGCLEQVMADCYGITTRNFVVQKGVALGLMLLFCILVVVAVGGSTLVTFLRQLQVPYVPAWITQGATGPVLTAVVGIASGVVLFFVIFWLVPKQRPAPQRALPGALFSGILFYVLTLVFPLYLSLNRGINQYGSQFAFLFTLLFFFYFLGLITVLGIEINATLFPLPKTQNDPAPEGAAAPRNDPSPREPPDPASSAEPPKDPGPRRDPGPRPTTDQPVSRRIPRPLFAVLGGALALGLAVVTGRRRSLSPNR